MISVQIARAAAMAALLAVSATAGLASAQVPGVPTQPIVTVSASATVTVSNDRLQAWLRAEAENPSPAAAASQVNAIIAKALAGARSYPAVKLATAGYSTQQISEKGKPSRWRVAQAVSLDSADFTAAAILITKLQDEDGLLLSGMGFSLSDKTRRDAEDGVTRQAIRSWQSRAEQAAQASAAVFDLADAVQTVADDADLGLKLRGIAHLLKIAASARAEISTRRRDALCAWLLDPDDLGKCQTPFNI